MDMFHHYLITTQYSQLREEGIVTIDRESYDGPPQDDNSGPYAIP